MEKKNDFRVFLFALFGFCFALNFISLVEAKEVNVIPQLSNEVVLRQTSFKSGYYEIVGGDVGNNNASLSRSSSPPKITYYGESSGVSRIEYKNSLVIDSKYLGKKHIPSSSGVKFSKGSTLKAGFKFAKKMLIVPTALETAMMVKDVFIDSGNIYKNVEGEELFVPEKTPEESYSCGSSDSCCIQNYTGADPNKFFSSEFIKYDWSPDKVALFCSYKGVNPQYPENISRYNAGFYISFGSSGGSVEEISVDEAIELVSDSFVPDNEYVEQVSNFYEYDPLVDSLYVSDVSDKYSFDSEVVVKESGDVVDVYESSVDMSLSFDDKGLSFEESERVDHYRDGELLGSSTSTTKYPSGDNSAPISEMPIDCDLFPRACEYFDWMQEPPNIGGDGLDFGLEEGQFDLPDFDPGMYEVTVPEFAPAICPAPLIIDGGLFGEHEITYDYICEHAKDMRPFIRISALLFSIAIMLGVSAKRR